MTRPCIIICAAADVESANLVLEELGRGPNSISRALCAIDPGATWETLVTHYLMQDMSATADDVAAWELLASEGGLPAAGIYSTDDPESPEARDAWRDAALQGEGLQIVPDVPL